MKAVALAMGVAVVVLGFFPEATSAESLANMLGIGLAALAVAALQKA